MIILYTWKGSMTQKGLRTYAIRLSPVVAFMNCGGKREAVSRNHRYTYASYSFSPFDTRSMLSLEYL